MFAAIMNIKACQNPPRLRKQYLSQITSSVKDSLSSYIICLHNNSQSRIGSHDFLLLMLIANFIFGKQILWKITSLVKGSLSSNMDVPSVLKVEDGNHEFWLLPVKYSFHLLCENYFAKFFAKEFSPQASMVCFRRIFKAEESKYEI